MKIAERYKTASSPIFSIEVLPPRNGTDEQQIFELVNSLQLADLGFVSVTMGSDRSLRGGGLALAYRIRALFNLEVLAHCTCVGRSQEDIENMLTECLYLGIENILALRGDPPQGDGGFIFHPRGHRYASEMVRQIVNMNNGMYLTRPTDREFAIVQGDGRYRKERQTDFCIGVAGHPDGHPECADFEKNFDHLKEKQDAGADFIITQAFYDIAVFKRFLDMAQRYGITIPIIPGVMPLIHMRNVKMAIEMFKVAIPEDMRRQFEKYADNSDELQRVGIDYAVRLCGDLIGLSVPGIQFYTLNQKDITKKILSMI